MKQKPGPKVVDAPALFYSKIETNRTCTTANVYEDCKCFSKF